MARMARARKAGIALLAILYLASVAEAFKEHEFKVNDAFAALGRDLPVAGEASPAKCLPYGNHSS